MRSSICIVLPVYNEEKTLEKSVETIREFLKGKIENTWEIIVIDNGSTDTTSEKGRGLSSRYPEVRYLHLAEKGRGRALKAAWRQSAAEIVAYMDIDLSTQLTAFPELIRAVEEGYDIAIGSRFIKGSKVKRGLGRGMLSRGYNRLLKIILKVDFSDAQCGFKAINRKVVEEVLPEVKDNAWFFDTELLYRAWKKGFRIKEVPITWTEDKDSKVKITKTVIDYLVSTMRLRSEFSSKRK